MGRTRRDGFTLVEMLVVMGLIVLLAGIGVAVSESGAFGSQKVVSGADRVSGWLLISKQRALRDARPRGVRFLLADDTTRPGVSSPNDYRNFSFVAKEAQYIELPDAWAPNPGGSATGATLAVSVSSTGSPRARLFLVSTDPAVLTEFDGRGLTTGDMVVFNGATFRLTDLPTNPKMPDVQVVGIGTLNSGNARELPAEAVNDLAVGIGFGAAVDASTTPRTAAIQTNLFAFQPAARPLVGEPLLQLTGNTVVDVRSKTFVAAVGGDPTSTPPKVVYAEPPPGGTSPGPGFWPRTTFGVRLQPVEFMNPTAGIPLPQYFDILFAPSGQVLNTDSGVIALWIRDPDKTVHPRLANPAQFTTTPGLDDPTVFDAAGEQVLVVVSPRTGLIATQPVTKGSDPHAAAKDGINSGL